MEKLLKILKVSWVVSITTMATYGAIGAYVNRSALFHPIIQLNRIDTLRSDLKSIVDQNNRVFKYILNSMDEIRNQNARDKIDLYADLAARIEKLESGLGGK